MISLFIQLHRRAIYKKNDSSKCFTSVLRMHIDWAKWCRSITLPSLLYRAANTELEEILKVEKIELWMLSNVLSVSISGCLPGRCCLSLCGRGRDRGRRSPEKGLVCVNKNCRHPHLPPHHPPPHHHHHHHYLITIIFLIIIISPGQRLRVLRWHQLGRGWGGRAGGRQSEPPFCDFQVIVNHNLW